VTNVRNDRPTVASAITVAALGETAPPPPITQPKTQGPDAPAAPKDAFARDGASTTLAAVAKAANVPLPTNLKEARERLAKVDLALKGKAADSPESKALAQEQQILKRFALGAAFAPSGSDVRPEALAKTKAAALAKMDPGLTALEDPKDNGARLLRAYGVGMPSLSGNKHILERVGVPKADLERFMLTGEVSSTLARVFEDAQQPPKKMWGPEQENFVAAQTVAQLIYRVGERNWKQALREVQGHIGALANQPLSPEQKSSALAALRQREKELSLSLQAAFDTYVPVIGANRANLSAWTATVSAEAEKNTRRASELKADADARGEKPSARTLSLLSAARTQHTALGTQYEASALGHKQGPQRDAAAREAASYFGKAARAELSLNDATDVAKRARELDGVRRAEGALALLGDEPSGPNLAANGDLSRLKADADRQYAAEAGEAGPSKTQRREIAKLKHDARQRILDDSGLKHLTPLEREQRALEVARSVEQHFWQAHAPAQGTLSTEQAIALRTEIRQQDHDAVREYRSAEGLLDRPDDKLSAEELATKAKLAREAAPFIAEVEARENEALDEAAARSVRKTQDSPLAPELAGTTREEVSEGLRQAEIALQKAKAAKTGLFSVTSSAAQHDQAIADAEAQVAVSKAKVALYANGLSPEQTFALRRNLAAAELDAARVALKRAEGVDAGKTGSSESNERIGKAKKGLSEAQKKNDELKPQDARDAAREARSRRQDAVEEGTLRLAPTQELRTAESLARLGDWARSTKALPPDLQREALKGVHQGFATLGDAAQTTRDRARVLAEQVRVADAAHQDSAAARLKAKEVLESKAVVFTTDAEKRQIAGQTREIKNEEGQNQIRLGAAHKLSARAASVARTQTAYAATMEALADAAALTVSAAPGGDRDHALADVARLYGRTALSAAQAGASPLPLLDKAADSAAIIKDARTQTLTQKQVEIDAWRTTSALFRGMAHGTQGITPALLESARTRAGQIEKQARPLAHDADAREYARLESDAKSAFPSALRTPEGARQLFESVGESIRLRGAAAKASVNTAATALLEKQKEATHPLVWFLSEPLAKWSTGSLKDEASTDITSATDRELGQLGDWQAHYEQALRERGEAGGLAALATFLAATAADSGAARQVAQEGRATDALRLHPALTEIVASDAFMDPGAARTQLVRSGLTPSTAQTGTLAQDTLDRSLHTLNQHGEHILAFQNTTWLVASTLVPMSRVGALASFGGTAASAGGIAARVGLASRLGLQQGTRAFSLATGAGRVIASTGHTVAVMKGQDILFNRLLEPVFGKRASLNAMRELFGVLQTGPAGPVQFASWRTQKLAQLAASGHALAVPLIDSSLRAHIMPHLSGDWQIRMEHVLDGVMLSGVHAFHETSAAFKRGSEARHNEAVKALEGMPAAQKALAMQLARFQQANEAASEHPAKLAAALDASSKALRANIEAFNKANPNEHIAREVIDTLIASQLLGHVFQEAQTKGLQGPELDAFVRDQVRTRDGSEIALAMAAQNLRAIAIEAYDGKGGQALTHTFEALRDELHGLSKVEALLHLEGVAKQMKLEGTRAEAFVQQLYFLYESDPRETTHREQVAAQREAIADFMDTASSATPEGQTRGPHLDAEEKRLYERLRTAGASDDTTASVRAQIAELRAHPAEKLVGATTPKTDSTVATPPPQRSVLPSLASRVSDPAQRTHTRPGEASWPHATREGRAFEAFKQRVGAQVADQAELMRLFLISGAAPRDAVFSDARFPAVRDRADLKADYELLPEGAQAHLAYFDMFPMAGANKAGGASGANELLRNLYGPTFDAYLSTIENAGGSVRFYRGPAAKIEALVVFPGTMPKEQQTQLLREAASLAQARAQELISHGKLEADGKETPLSKVPNPEDKSYTGGLRFAASSRPFAKRETFEAAIDAGRQENRTLLPSPPKTTQESKPIDRPTVLAQVPFEHSAEAPASPSVGTVEGGPILSSARRRSAFVEGLVRQGSDRKAAEAFFDEHLKLDSKVTGTHRAEELEPTLEHAAAWARQTGGSVLYAESDVGNLGGLTKRMEELAGDVTKGRDIADGVFRHITNLYIGEVSKVMKQLGGEAHFFRKGGDEFGAVLLFPPNTPEEARVDVQLAMLRTQMRVAEFVETATVAPGGEPVALRNIEHLKHLGKPDKAGSGITFGLADLDPAKPVAEALKAADSRVEQKKSAASILVAREKLVKAAGVPEAEAPAVARELLALELEQRQDGLHDRKVALLKAHGGSDERIRRALEGKDRAFSLRPPPASDGYKPNKELAAALKELPIEDQRAVLGLCERYPQLEAAVRQGSGPALLAFGESVAKRIAFSGRDMRETYAAFAKNPRETVKALRLSDEPKPDHSQPKTPRALADLLLPKPAKKEAHETYLKDIESLTQRIMQLEAAGLLPEVRAFLDVLAHEARLPLFERLRGTESAATLQRLRETHTKAPELAAAMLLSGLPLEAAPSYDRQLGTLNPHLTGSFHPVTVNGQSMLLRVLPEGTTGVEAGALANDDRARAIVALPNGGIGMLTPIRPALPLSETRHLNQDGTVARIHEVVTRLRSNGQDIAAEHLHITAGGQVYFDPAHVVPFDAARPKLEMQALLRDMRVYSYGEPKQRDRAPRELLADLKSTPPPAWTQGMTAAQMTRLADELRKLPAGHTVTVTLAPEGSTLWILDTRATSDGWQWTAHGVQPDGQSRGAPSPPLWPALGKGSSINLAQDLRDHAPWTTAIETAPAPQREALARALLLLDPNREVSLTMSEGHIAIMQPAADGGIETRLVLPEGGIAKHTRNDIGAPVSSVFTERFTHGSAERVAARPGEVQAELALTLPLPDVDPALLSQASKEQKKEHELLDETLHHIGPGDIAAVRSELAGRFIPKMANGFWFDHIGEMTGTRMSLAKKAAEFLAKADKGGQGEALYRALHDRARAAVAFIDTVLPPHFRLPPGSLEFTPVSKTGRWEGGSRASKGGMANEIKAIKEADPKRYFERARAIIGHPGFHAQLADEVPAWTGRTPATAADVEAYKAHRLAKLMETAAFELLDAAKLGMSDEQKQAIAEGLVLQWSRELDPRLQVAPDAVALEFLLGKPAADADKKPRADGFIRIPLPSETLAKTPAALAEHTKQVTALRQQYAEPIPGKAMGEPVPAPTWEALDRIENPRTALDRAVRDPALKARAFAAYDQLMAKVRPEHQATLRTYLRLRFAEVARMSNEPAPYHPETLVRMLELTQTLSLSHLDDVRGLLYALARPQDASPELIAQFFDAAPVALAGVRTSPETGRAVVQFIQSARRLTLTPGDDRKLLHPSELRELVDTLTKAPPAVIAPLTDLFRLGGSAPIAIMALHAMRARLTGPDAQAVVKVLTAVSALERSGTGRAGERAASKLMFALRDARSPIDAPGLLAKAKGFASEEANHVTVARHKAILSADIDTHIARDASAIALLKSSKHAAKEDEVKFLVASNPELAAVVLPGLETIDPAILRQQDLDTLRSIHATLPSEHAALLREAIASIPSPLERVVFARAISEIWLGLRIGEKRPPFDKALEASHAAAAKFRADPNRALEALHRAPDMLYRASAVHELQPVVGRDPIISGRHFAGRNEMLLRERAATLGGEFAGTLFKETLASLKKKQPALSEKEREKRAASFVTGVLEVLSAERVALEPGITLIVPAGVDRNKLDAYLPVLRWYADKARASGHDFARQRQLVLILPESVHLVGDYLPHFSRGAVGFFDPDHYQGEANVHLAAAPLHALAGGYAEGAVLTHELGGHLVADGLGALRVRNGKTLGEAVRDVLVTLRRDASSTEYGKSNDDEALAEWFTAYAGVATARPLPSQIRALFDEAFGGPPPSPEVPLPPTARGTPLPPAIMAARLHRQFLSHHTADEAASLAAHAYGQAAAQELTASLPEAQQAGAQLVIASALRDLYRLQGATHAKAREERLGLLNAQLRASLDAPQAARLRLAVAAEVSGPHRIERTKTDAEYDEQFALEFGKETAKSLAALAGKNVPELAPVLSQALLLLPRDDLGQPLSGTVPKMAAWKKQTEAALHGALKPLIADEATLRQTVAAALAAVSKPALVQRSEDASVVAGRLALYDAIDAHLPDAKGKDRAGVLAIRDAMVDASAIRDFTVGILQEVESELAAKQTRWKQERGTTLPDTPAVRQGVLLAVLVRRGKAAGFPEKLLPFYGVLGSEAFFQNVVAKGRPFVDQAAVGSDHGALSHFVQMLYLADRVNPMLAGSEGAKTVLDLFAKIAKNFGAVNADRATNPWEQTVDIVGSASNPSYIEAMLRLVVPVKTELIQPTRAELELALAEAGPKAKELAAELLYQAQLVSRSEEELYDALARDQGPALGLRERTGLSTAAQDKARSAMQGANLPPALVHVLMETLFPSQARAHWKEKDRVVNIALALTPALGRDAALATAKQLGGLPRYITIGDQVLAYNGPESVLLRFRTKAIDGAAARQEMMTLLLAKNVSEQQAQAIAEYLIPRAQAKTVPAEDAAPPAAVRRPTAIAPKQMSFDAGPPTESARPVVPQMSPPKPADAGSATVSVIPEGAPKTQPSAAATAAEPPALLQPGSPFIAAAEAVHITNGPRTLGRFDGERSDWHITELEAKPSPEVMRELMGHAIGQVLGSSVMAWTSVRALDAASYVAQERAPDGFIAASPAVLNDPRYAQQLAEIRLIDFLSGHEERALSSLLVNPQSGKVLAAGLGLTNDKPTLPKGIPSVHELPKKVLDVLGHWNQQVVLMTFRQIYGREENAAQNGLHGFILRLSQAQMTLGAAPTSVIPTTPLGRTQARDATDAAIKNAAPSDQAKRERLMAGVQATRTQLRGAGPLTRDAVHQALMKQLGPGEPKREALSAVAAALHVELEATRRKAEELREPAPSRAAVLKLEDKTEHALASLQLSKRSAGLTEKMVASARSAMMTAVLDENTPPSVERALSELGKQLGRSADGLPQLRALAGALAEEVALTARYNAAKGRRLPTEPELQALASQTTALRDEVRKLRPEAFDAALAGTTAVIQSAFAARQLPDEDETVAHLAQALGLTGQGRETLRPLVRALLVEHEGRARLQHLGADLPGEIDEPGPSAQGTLRANGLSLADKQLGVLRGKTDHSVDTLKLRLSAERQRLTNTGGDPKAIPTAQRLDQAIAEARSAGETQMEPILAGLTRALAWKDADKLRPVAKALAEELAHQNAE
jgi:hypothetical protein